MGIVKQSIDDWCKEAVWYVSASWVESGRVLNSRREVCEKLKLRWFFSRDRLYVEILEYPIADRWLGDYRGAHHNPFCTIAFSVREDRVDGAVKDLDEAVKDLERVIKEYLPGINLGRCLKCGDWLDVTDIGYCVQCNLAVDAQKKECVYFLEDSHTGLIKIGRSKHLTTRLKNLAAGNPTLIVLGVIPDGYDRELDLHTRFSDNRVTGEWFDINRKDLKAVDDVVFFVMSVEDFTSDNFNYP